MSDKNNNPFNVKQWNPPWKGSTGRDARGHANFSNVAYSVRATVRTLAQKAANGKTSLMAIFFDYAPIDDGNDPAGYAEFVAGRMGISASEKLYIFGASGQIARRGDLKAMLRAMAEMEVHAGYQLDSDELELGLFLYERDFGKKPKSLGEMEQR